MKPGVFLLTCFGGVFSESPGGGDPDFLAEGNPELLLDVNPDFHVEGTPDLIVDRNPDFPVCGLYMDVLNSRTC